MIVRESISFERHRDPKHTLNIGMRTKIEEWLEEYYHEVSNATRASKYTINDDLTIDIDGFFVTDWPGNLPDFIQFNEIRGNFVIQGDLRRSVVKKGFMTSLKGCPKIVKGEFNCSRNDLNNLIGGPETVSGNYTCSLNPHLKSLKGIATSIGGDLDCNNKSGLTEKDIPPGTKIVGRPNVHYWADW